MALSKGGVFRDGGIALGLGALFLLGASTGALAETRGYAISLLHTATYPGKDDCPKGGNGGNTEIQERILMRHGYTKEQAQRIVANEGKDDNGHRFNFEMRGQLDGHAVGIGDFPTSVPDPQIETVAGAGPGHFAYGFNLAGHATPDSFEDPDTHELIQNQMWRVLGCFGVYQVKHPVIPYNEAIAWDTAEDDMPAWLLSISGDDLSKDGDVTVTFDRSLDIAMRNTHGVLLSGSSYVIDTDPRSHSVFKGHIKDGVLTVDPGDFSMQGESQFYAVLRFKQTHLRLKIKPDGTLFGIIGGYQPWLDYYYYLAVRSEVTAQVDVPGTYYAMKRLADGLPDPTSGQNTAISAAYYLEAVPAFLTSAAGKVVGTAYMSGSRAN
jgi:hypothetical protein